MNCMFLVVFIPIRLNVIFFYCVLIPGIIDLLSNIMIIIKRSKAF